MLTYKNIISNFTNPAKLTRLTVGSLLFFLMFFLLWKGGKELEATWLLTALAWFCSYQYWKSKPKRKVTVPFWLWTSLIALIGLSAASFLQSTTANYGLDEVLRTGAYVFIFLWMARTIHEESGGEIADKILKFIAYGTLIACGIGFAVYLLQPVSRFVGTFFDMRFHTDYFPNAWAEYLLLSWPVVLWWSQDWCIKTKKLSVPLMRTVCFICIMTLVIGSLFLSYSRGSMIAFVGQIALWSWFIYRKGARKDVFIRLAKRGVLIFIAAILFFYAANILRSGVYEVESVGDKVTFTAAEGTSSVSERTQFWVQAAKLSYQKPLFGWGPYSFRFIQPRMQENVLATSDHAHNMFLKTTMEQGIPAGVLLAFIIFSVLIISYIKWEKGKAKTIQNLDIIPLLLISVIGVVAHNLIDYNLQFVGIALPMWLMLGMLGSILFKKKGFKITKKMTLWLEIIVVTILMVIAIVEAPSMVMSSLGRHAEARGNSEEALVWYGRSGYQIFSRDLDLSRTVLLLSLERYDEANAALDDYMKDNEEDARAWKLRGDICRAQMEWDCALDNYDRAYDLNRFNDLSIARANIETLRSAGKKREIDDRKGEFDSLMMAYGNAIQINSHFIALSQNVDELVILSNFFAKVYPREEPKYVTLGAKAANKASEEKARINARPPGYLW